MGRRTNSPSPFIICTSNWVLDSTFCAKGRDTGRGRGKGDLCNMWALMKVTRLGAANGANLPWRTCPKHGRGTQGKPQGPQNDGDYNACMCTTKPVATNRLRRDRRPQDDDLRWHVGHGACRCELRVNCFNVFNEGQGRPGGWPGPAPLRPPVLVVL